MPNRYQYCAECAYKEKPTCAEMPDCKEAAAAFGSRPYTKSKKINVLNL